MIDASGNDARGNAKVTSLATLFRGFNEKAGKRISREVDVIVTTSLRN